MTTINLADAIDQLPLVGILRGIKPEEVIAVAEVIRDAGFLMIEIPLNSPRPYESIKQLVDAMGDEVLIGAGTVLNPDQVDEVYQAGGRLIVTPNTNPDVIRRAKEKDMYALPGCYTPTEAFSAIDAGADVLKLFPTDAIAPEKLKAMLAVLPDIPIFPVGGVTKENMLTFIQAGAKGFGLGSGLYKPGMTIQQVEQNAQGYVTAYRAALGS